MRVTILQLLLLLVSSVTSQEPICRDFTNITLCGGRCLLPNVTDAVKCINGACCIVKEDFQVFGEEILQDLYCPHALNACGDETFCGDGQSCQGGSCTVPTLAPTFKVVTTCEDLGYCQDKVEACIEEVDRATDASCISVEELCKGDKETVCIDTGVLYFYNRKVEGWDEPFRTTQETICSSRCRGNSGAGSLTFILSVILAIVGAFLL